MTSCGICRLSVRGQDTQSTWFVRPRKPRMVHTVASSIHLANYPSSTQRRAANRTVSVTRCSKTEMGIKEAHGKEDKTRYVKTYDDDAPPPQTEQLFTRRSPWCPTPLLFSLVAASSCQVASVSDRGSMAVRSPTRSRYAHNPGGPGT